MMQIHDRRAKYILVNKCALFITPSSGNNFSEFTTQERGARGIRIIYNFGRSLKKSPGTLQILTASSEVITQSLFKKFMAIPMNVSC